MYYLIKYYDNIYKLALSDKKDLLNISYVYIYKKIKMILNMKENIINEAAGVNIINLDIKLTELCKIEEIYVGILRNKKLM